MRTWIINALYNVASKLCELADKLSPTCDEIWRDRRWRQWDEQRGDIYGTHEHEEDIWGKPSDEPEDTVPMTSDGDWGLMNRDEINDDVDLREIFKAKLAMWREYLNG